MKSLKDWLDEKITERQKWKREFAVELFSEQYDLRGLNVDQKTVERQAGEYWFVWREGTCRDGMFYFAQIVAKDFLKEVKFKIKLELNDKRTLDELKIAHPAPEHS